MRLRTRAIERGYRMAAADQMLGPEAIASADPGFTMRPLSWQTGTEIGGLDLTRSDAIPEPVISALWRLVCERGILLFRDQFLTHDQHLDFTRPFGPLAESGFVLTGSAPGRARGGQLG